MPRGGRDKTLEREDGTDRRCIATGEAQPRVGLIRFVSDPDGMLTPDLAEKLPGRGVWVTSTRDALDKAIAKGMFSRGLKRKVDVPDGFAARIEALLTKRQIDAIAIARKAGKAVCGFERTKEALWSGRTRLLFAASDGSEDGKSKLRGLAESARIVSVLTSAELGLAFGRDFVIHAALLDGGATTRAIREARRLEGFRS
jgi:predicted RNA-binding protein YlxR (DUF448 family)